MRRHLRKDKKGFTLAEIIASIALIAVVGVFLAQMFALSDRLTEKASTTDRAVTLCASIADQWKAGSSAEGLAGISDIAKYVQIGDGVSVVPVDAGMNPCAESQAAFILEIAIAETPDYVYDMHIRVLEADEVLYELDSSRYFARTGDGS